MKLILCLLMSSILSSCAYSLKDKTKDVPRLENLPEIVHFSNGHGFERKFTTKTFLNEFQCEKEQYQYINRMCDFVSAVGDKKLGYNGILKVTFDHKHEGPFFRVWRILNLLTLGLIPFWDIYFYNLSYEADGKKLEFSYEVTEYRSSLLVPFTLFIDSIYDKEEKLYNEIFK